MNSLHLFNNFHVMGLADIGESAKIGRVHIRIRPTGYWTDVINARLVREWGDGQVWEKRISTSSGGRNSDISDIEAMGYFVEAIKFAIELLNSINTDEMERIYQAQREKEREDSKAKVSVQKALNTQKEVK